MNVKKLLSLLAAAAMAVTAVTGAISVSAETVATGECGESVNWTLDSDGVLTISGEGPMDQGDLLLYTHWTYSEYADKVKEVVFEEGVTTVGQCAFSSQIAYENYYPNLTKVTFASTIDEIGTNSFKRTDIESISLPEGLKYIGESAFSETKIKSINLHEGMTIGGSAFQRCNSLKEVIIPRNTKFSLTSIGGMGMGRAPSTFADCTGLEKIVIEDGYLITDSWTNVQTQNGVAENLCANCTSLKTVIIKGEIEGIMPSSFNGFGGRCPSLSDIYFYNTGLTKIEAKGTANGYGDSIDTTNNPTFHVIKGSKTEQTLKNAGYLTDDNTVYLADTTALETAIADADAIDTSKYTDETVSALTTAVENAKAVLENLDATQEEVDKAATAIETAIKALKLNNSSNSQQQTPNKNSQQQTPNKTTPQTPTTARPTKSTRSAAQVKKDKSAAKKAMKQAKITKLTAKSKAKKIAVSWKKVKNAKGYQVQVSAKKNFKKVIYNKSLTKNKLTIKSSKIKSKKTYYVRVRAYATYKDANNATKKIYSKWVKKIRKVKAK